MSEALTLEIVTPERMVLAEEAVEITAPGWGGEFGVLAGHTPFLAALRTGELSFMKEGERYHLAVAGGFVEVTEGKVTVLAESAELATEIDLEGAEQAQAKAKLRLDGLSASDPVYLQASQELDQAITRVRVASRVSPR